MSNVITYTKADLAAFQERRDSARQRALDMGANERQAHWFSTMPEHVFDGAQKLADGQWETKLNTLTVHVTLEGKTVYVKTQQVYEVTLADGTVKRAQHEDEAGAMGMFPGAVSAKLAADQPKPNTNPYCRSGNRPSCTCDSCF
jgi:hypothetical protein